MENTNSRYDGGMRGIRLALEQSIREQREKERHRVKYPNDPEWSQEYFTDAIHNMYINPYSHAGRRLGREKGEDPVKEITSAFYQLLYVLGIPNC